MTILKGEPTEELMWDKAECRCGESYRGALGTAMEWSKKHSAETGHYVMVTHGYDVRPEDWRKRHQN